MLNDFQMQLVHAVIVFSTILLGSCSERHVTRPMSVRLIVDPLVRQLVNGFMGSCALDTILQFCITYSSSYLMSVCQHYSHMHLFIASCFYYNKFSAYIIDGVIGWHVTGISTALHQSVI